MRLLYRLKTRVELLLTKIKEFVQSLVPTRDILIQNVDTTDANSDINNSDNNCSSNYEENISETNDDNICEIKFDNNIHETNSADTLNHNDINASETHDCDEAKNAIDNSEPNINTEYSHFDNNNQHSYTNSSTNEEFENFKKTYIENQRRNMFAKFNPPLPTGKSSELKKAFVLQLHEVEYFTWFRNTGFKINTKIWRDQVRHRIKNVTSTENKSNYEKYRNSCNNTDKKIIDPDAKYTMYLYDNYDYCDIYNYESRPIGTFICYLNVSKDDRLKFISDMSLCEFVGTGLEILQFILAWHLKTEYVVLDQNNNPVLAA